MNRNRLYSHLCNLHLHINFNVWIYLYYIYLVFFVFYFLNSEILADTPPTNNAYVVDVHSV